MDAKSQHVLLFLFLACRGYLAEASCKDTGTCQVTYTQAQLRRRLSPWAYYVTQQRGTERPFSGQLLYNNRKGIYQCTVCNNPIFSSDAKYNPGTGWPSFYDVIGEGAVTISTDRSYGWNRQEVTCARCGAHLGHVFNDGPPPTGKRYCINSVALLFQPSMS